MDGERSERAECADGKGGKGRRGGDDSVESGLEVKGEGGYTGA